MTGLLHRDVAARNILLETSDAGSFRARLCDFGLSSRTDIPYGFGDRKPLVWPPEAFKVQVYDCAGDVWSFGLLLWQVMSQSLEVRQHTVRNQGFHPQNATGQGEPPLVDVLTKFAESLLEYIVTPNTTPSSAEEAEAAPPLPVLNRAGSIPVEDYGYGLLGDTLTPYVSHVEANSEKLSYKDLRDRLQLPKKIAQAVHPLELCVCAHLIQWCTRIKPNERPSMSLVSELLEVHDSPSLKRLLQRSWPLEWDNYFMSQLSKQRASNTQSRDLATWERFESKEDPSERPPLVIHKRVSKDCGPGIWNLRPGAAGVFATWYAQYSTGTCAQVCLKAIPSETVGAASSLDWITAAFAKAPAMPASHDHIFTCDSLCDLGEFTPQQYCLVLPFSEGFTLDEAFRSQSALFEDHDTVVTLAGELASALTALHAQQIVHSYVTLTVFWTFLMHQIFVC